MGSLIDANWSEGCEGLVVQCELEGYQERITVKHSLLSALNTNRVEKEENCLDFDKSPNLTELKRGSCRECRLCFSALSRTFLK